MFLKAFSPINLTDFGITTLVRLVSFVKAPINSKSGINPTLKLSFAVLQEAKGKGAENVAFSTKSKFVSSPFIICHAKQNHPSVKIGNPILAKYSALVICSVVTKFIPAPAVMFGALSELINPQALSDIVPV